MVDVFSVRLDYLTVSFYSERGSLLTGYLADKLGVGFAPARDLFGMSGLAEFDIPDGQGSASLFSLRDDSGRLHVRVSGAVTELVHRALDLLEPSYSHGLVTRYDVAVDMSLTDRDYGTLASEVDRVARSSDGAEGRPSETSVAGDWLGGVKGRTLYVGAPSSALRLRFYEKGIQLGGSSSWVRLEWQVRPSVPLRVEDVKYSPPTDRYARILQAVTGRSVLSESLVSAQRDPAKGGLQWLERMALTMLRKETPYDQQQFIKRLSGAL